MSRERLVTGLTVTFGVLTAVLVVVALVANPAVLVLAGVFGAATYLLYDHASGRMAARVYERVEQQARVEDRGGFGAGPREDWTGPRDGRTARSVGGRGRAQQRARRGAQRTRGRGGDPRDRAPSTSGPSAAEAYERLGLDPDADEAAVKDAYREKVKEVHPDNDGDEEAFKKVTAAYERLTD